MKARDKDLIYIFHPDFINFCIILGISFDDVWWKLWHLISFYTAIWILSAYNSLKVNCRFLSFRYQCLGIQKRHHLHRTQITFLYQYKTCIKKVSVCIIMLQYIYICAKPCTTSQYIHTIWCKYWKNIPKNRRIPCNNVICTRHAGCSCSLDFAELPTEAEIMHGDVCSNSNMTSVS